MRQWGIHARLLLLALLPTLALGIGLSAYFVHSAVVDLELALHARGEAIVQSTAPAAEYGVFSGNRRALQALAEGALDQADVRQIVITDSNGVILAVAGESTGILRLPVPLAPSTEAEESNALLFAAPILPARALGDDPLDPSADLGGKPPVTLGWVRAKLSLAPLHERQAAVIGNGLLLTMLGLVAAILLGWLMARALSAPLVAITTTVRELGAGNLQARVQTHGSGEIEELKSGINTMAESLHQHNEQLERKVAQATNDLRQALAILKDQNIELEEARLDALRLGEIKSRFVANMSHEIRTPLNGVIGFLELLANTDVNATQRNFLDSATISARQLLAIVNEVLDFSRLESGNMPIEQIPLNLATLLEDAVAPLRPAALAKKIDLATEVGTDVPTRLIGDPLRLAQIVNNLVSNAVKFTARGRVTVRVERLAETELRTTLRLSVIDTGIGLTQDEQLSIFRPFTQGDSTTTRRYGGTGLGLSITKQLAELMGGHIGVESRPGEGSQFWVELTLEKQLTADHPPLPPNVRVLIVSAGDNHVSALRAWLEHWGAETRLIASGAEAIATLDDNNTRSLWDIVVLDYTARTADPQDLAAAALARARRGLIVLADEAGREALGTLALTERARILPPDADADSLYTAVQGLLMRAAAATPVAARGALRVLVADDNPINRQLAAVLLSQTGADVDEVEDGIGAVEACSRHQYDLILMDVHMPILDGLGATRQLRAFDAAHGRRTPVIAVTASAIDGERARLLAAGMDDYLAKPITRAALVAMITKWCPSRAGEVVTPDEGAGPANYAAENIAGEPAILDRRYGLELAGGDEALWKTGLRMLMEQLPEQLDGLHEAASRSDFAKMREIAHRLAGSAGYVGAPALRLAAQELERASIARDTRRASDALQSLEGAAEALRAELASQH